MAMLLSPTDRTASTDVWDGPIPQVITDPDRINRVVLISDGGANLGVTSEQLIGSYSDPQRVVRPFALEGWTSPEDDPRPVV